MVADALTGGQFVVLLLPQLSPAMSMLVDRLAADGPNAAIIPAARPLAAIPFDDHGAERSGAKRSGTDRPDAGAMVHTAIQPAIQSAIQSAGRHGRAWHAGDRP
jgi:hypothetical protein